MGEYADYQGERIKIGTCESMYYLRYDDRFKVTHVDGNVNAAKDLNLFWRLPFPDEDHETPGSYEDYNRGFRLYGSDNGDFPLPDNSPGIVQLTHECGLLVNLPCYHGTKLPEVKKPLQVFWNGKSWFAELAHIKNTKDELLPVVRCRFCRHMWRYEWDEIMPYVHDAIMKQRLEAYRMVKV